MVRLEGRKKRHFSLLVPRGTEWKAKLRLEKQERACTGGHRVGRVEFCSLHYISMPETIKGSIQPINMGISQHLYVQLLIA